MVHPPAVQRLAPESHDGWKRYSFLLGPGRFSGDKLAVSLWECKWFARFLNGSMYICIYTSIYQIIMIPFRILNNPGLFHCSYVTKGFTCRTVPFASKDSWNAPIPQKRHSFPSGLHVYKYMSIYIYMFVNTPFLESNAYITSPFVLILF